jgi:outer membrane lipoprotein-sorting protein
MITGCAPMVPTIGQPVSKTAAQDLLNGLADTARQIRSVQGLAVTQISSPEQSGSVRQVILAERPNHFRLEVMTPFGTPLLILAANGNDLAVLSQSRNQFYLGSASPQNLARFTRVPLKPDDLVNLLLYRVPLIAEQVVSAYWLPNQHWLIELKRYDRRQELVFNSLRQLVETRYFDRDTMFLKVVYSRHGELIENYPAKLEIALPEFDIKASIDFKDQAINRTFLPEIFKLIPPAGTAIINLDETSLSD